MDDNQYGNHGPEAMEEQKPREETEHLASAEVEPEADDTRCAKCGERERDTVENRRSVLCMQCREELIRLRIPGKIKVFLLVLCAVFAVAMGTFFTALPHYRQYAQAQRHMGQREYLYALQLYQELLPGYGHNPKVSLQAAKAAMSAQDFSTLVDILDTYVAGKQLNDSQYAQATHYVRFLEDYGETLYDIMTAAEGVQLPDDASLEERAEATHQALLALEEGAADKAAIYYNLGLTSGDTGERIHYLEMACQQDTESTYPLAYYGNALRRAGRAAEAEAVFQKAILLNACDAEAYRGMSILQLLAGEKQEALDTIRIAQRMAPENTSILNALIIALLENGQVQEAEPLIEQFREDGEIQDEDLRGYLAEEVDVRQYYLDDKEA